MDSDDVSSEGRVTRARRRRLISIDSEASSRPGTPLSPERVLKGNSKNENDALPKRVTRRNSLSNTPQKTPLKKENDTSDVVTPATRTRRRSMSITEDNTPQKLNKKQSYLTVLPEEDVKEEQGYKKSGKRNAEKSVKGGKSKSPTKNTLKPLRKTIKKEQENILKEDDFDSDTVEIINLDNTYESKDGFKQESEDDPLETKNENPLQNDITTENTAADRHQAPMNFTDIFVSLAALPTKAIDNSFESVEKEISPNKDTMNADVIAGGTPNSFTTADDQSKLSQSKSVTFENNDSSDELKVAFPKTPSIRKKSSPLSTSSGVNKKRLIGLTVSMIDNEEIENEMGDVLESEQEEEAPEKNEAKVTESDNSVKTPTPEKLLRSGKKYGDSPETENNLLNEISPKNARIRTNSKRFKSLNLTNDENDLDKEVTSNQSPKSPQSGLGSLTIDRGTNNNSTERNKEKSEKGHQKDHSTNTSSPTKMPPQMDNPIEMRSNDSNKENSNETEFHSNLLATTKSTNNESLAECIKESYFVERSIQPSTSVKDFNDQQENCIVRNESSKSPNDCFSHNLSSITTLKSKSPLAIKLNEIQKSKERNQVTERSKKEELQQISLISSVEGNAHNKENTANNENLGENSKEIPVEKTTDAPSVKNVDDLQENLEVEKKVYANSWIQSVKKSSFKIDTIACEANEKSPSKTKNGKEVVKDKKTVKKNNSENSVELNLRLQDESTSEDDNEDEHENSEDEEIRSFFEHEAKDMGKDYKSGDSMDEEERELYAENPDRDEGESIGSVDTSEEEIEDDNSEENNSFIVSSDEDELILEYSDDDEHLKDCNENLHDEIIKKKVHTRVRKISTESEEDEQAFNVDVTHMIDETIANGMPVNDKENDVDSSKGDCNNENNQEKTPSQNDVKTEKDLSTEIPLNEQRKKHRSSIEDTEVNGKDQSSDVPTTQKSPSSRRSRNVSLIENNEVQNKEEKISNRSRRSRSISFINENNVESGEVYISETPNSGKIEKSRHSRNISLMDDNELGTGEYGSSEDGKKKSNKSRRSGNISLMETNEEEHSYETQQKSRGAENVSQMEDREIENQEEEGNSSEVGEEKPKKSRSRNISLKDNNVVEEEKANKSRHSRNVSLMENNEVQNEEEKISNRSRRSRSISFINENNVESGEEFISETQHSGKIEKSRHSRNISFMDDNELGTGEYGSSEDGKKKSNKSRRSGNISLMETNEEEHSYETQQKSRGAENVSQMEDREIENQEEEGNSSEVGEEKPQKSRSRNISFKDNNVVEEEKANKSRHSRNGSLMENNEVQNEEEKISNRSRRSRSISFINENNVESGEEFISETQHSGKIEKSRHSRNICFMGDNELGTGEYGSSEDGKKKSRRSGNISLMETNEEEHSYETQQKSRRAENVFQMEHREIENQEEEGNSSEVGEEKPQKSRSRNISFKDNNVVEEEKANKSRHSRNGSLMENNDVQNEEEKISNRSRRSRSISFINENNVESGEEFISETQHSGKIEKSRHSRNISLMENNEDCHSCEAQQSEQTNKTPRSKNVALISENEDRNGESLISEKKSKKSRQSQNTSLMEKDKTKKENDHSFETQKKASASPHRSRKLSTVEFNEDENTEGHPVEEKKHDKIKKSRSQNMSMETFDIEEEHKMYPPKHSISNIETANEQSTPKEYKKRKLSVSLSYKQDHMNSDELNNDDPEAHSVKKMKLSFEENTIEKTVKIHAKNTSTPFVNKKSNISNRTQDISKILQRCNQMLENAEKLKKNSREVKPKEKKKKIKSRIANEVNDTASTSNGDDFMKRAALHQAIQASQNLLSKPNKKRRREPLESQNDENNYESKRLPMEILASLSSSNDGDSTIMPKKRKKNNFGEKVIKSTAGDIIVETPIEVATPQPKKIKPIEIIKTTTGEVRVEPITPLTKKINNAGFRESPITPKVTGWKMLPVSAVAEKKRKRHLVAAIVEPRNTLPKPSWTKTAGTFKIEKVQQPKNTQRFGATEFEVIPLNKYGVRLVNKKTHKQTSTSSALSAAERAVNFREKALYRENIPREDARSVLRRKRFLH